jgi:hypothetical protein
MQSTIATDSTQHRDGGRTTLAGLTYLIVDGLIPLLPGIVMRLADQRVSYPTKDRREDLLGALLLVDTIYLVVLGLSAILWGLSPLPSGTSIIGGIKLHLLHDPLSGAAELLALSLGFLSILLRLVLFVVVALSLLLQRPLPRRIRLDREHTHEHNDSTLSQTDPRAPNTRGSTLVIHGVAIVGFCALELVFALRTHLGLHLGSGLLAEHSADPVTFVWFIRWWPYAITHHLNPFMSSIDWFPHGYDLSWATPIPVLSLVMWPITSGFGAIVSYNVLTILAAPLAAYGAFLLGRALRLSPAGSIAIGLIYGFSPYVFAQERGHLNLIYAMIPPVVGAIWLHYRAGRLGPRGTIVLLGIAFAVQFGISNEIYATLGLFFVALLLADYGITRSGPKALRRSDLTVAAGGLLLSIILISPYLYEMLTHLHTNGVNSPFGFSNDVFGILLPNPLEPFGGSVTHITTALIAKGSELDGYLALPLLLVVVCISVLSLRGRGSSTLRALVYLFFLSFVISLGPQLQSHGQYWLPPFGATGSFDVAIMPWDLPARLPILNNILPDRLSLYTALFMALVLVKGFEERGALLRVSTPRWSWQSIIGLGLIVIGFGMSLPLTEASVLGVSYAPLVPRFFSSSALHRCLGAHPVTLNLPFGGAGFAMGDQAAADFSFAMAGGYLGTAPSWTQGDPLYQALLAGAPLPKSMETSFASQLRQMGITAVITPSSIGAPWTSYVGALGKTYPLVCSEQGVNVYRA